MRSMNPYSAGESAPSVMLAGSGEIPPTELMLYLPNNMEFGFRLLETIRNAVSGYEIEICSSLGVLSKKLSRRTPDIGVAVLCASTGAELAKLAFLADFLGERRVVLVVPDGQPELLEKACIIRPWLIAATVSDLKHLGRVLRRRMNLCNKMNWMLSHR